MIWCTCCFIFREVKVLEGKCKFFLTGLNHYAFLLKMLEVPVCLGLANKWVIKLLDFCYSHGWQRVLSGILICFLLWVKFNVFFPECNGHLPFFFYGQFVFLFNCLSAFWYFFYMLRAFSLLGRSALSFLYKSQTFSLDFAVASFVYRVFYPRRRVYFLVKCIHLSCVLFLDLEFS